MGKMTAVVALMAVFSLSICFVLIGAVSVELSQKLGIDNSQVGSLVSALFTTSMIVQLFVGLLVDKAGHKVVAIFGFLITSGSIFTLAAATSFTLALYACTLLGVGAMCVCTVGNTLLPIVLFEGKEPARASNLGNGFFGLAFLVTSGALGYLVHTLQFSLAAALSSVGALVLIFGVFAAVARYPKVSIGFSFGTALRLLGQPPVLLAAVALVCYIAMENAMNTWTKPLVTEVLGGSSNSSAVTTGGFILGLFGLAIAVGRFLSSTIKNLTRIGAKFVAGLAVFSILAILVVSYSSSPALVIGTILLLGLAFAPMFPTIVGVTFARYEPKFYGSIFGIIFAIGLLGPMIVPKTIGKLSMTYGVQRSMAVSAVIALLLCIVALLMGKSHRTQE
jgi:fucose permease